MDIPILYEDYSVVVVDKPAGVLVLSEKKGEQQTISDWARKRVGSGQWAVGSEEADFHKRAGIVHRLDKETSGCLVIAKTFDAFSKLTQAFKNRQVKKTYIALVHGKVVPEKGEVRAPLGRMPGKKWKFGVVPSGKEAITRYKVINYYSSSDPGGTVGRVEKSPMKFSTSSNKKKSKQFSLLELYPQTGRTHQIRIHLKHLGYPIVGDYLYAPKKQTMQDRLWCPRVFLHARNVTFPHPVKNTNVTVESSLPPLLQKVLESLAGSTLR